MVALAEVPLFKLVTGRFPTTPVERGSPVQLVNTPLVGVPRRGVIRAGLVSMTNLEPVPVCEATEVAFPTEVIGPVRFALVASLPFNFWIAWRIESVAETVPAPDVNPVRTLAITAALVKVVAFPIEVTSPVRLALVVTFPEVRPDAVPEIFVPTKTEGVPRDGVTRVGDVANTRLPDPVSSEMTPANSEDVVAAKAESLSVVTTKVLEVGIAVLLTVEMRKSPAPLLFTIVLAVFKSVAALAKSSPE